MRYDIGRNEYILHAKNQAVCRDLSFAGLFGADEAAKVRRYHESFPTYSPTALVRLEGLAREIGLGEVFVKDESTRFGLNAFKGLGGSYCVGRVLAERAGISPEGLTFDRLRQNDVKEAAKGLTLVTATDGNHGRGIAWTAHELGIPAVVYLPKGSARERLENIRKLGAHAEITELNYDDTVRYAAQCEKERGWVLVQDTSWEGYEKLPTWIMQGYTTMALEAAHELGDKVPTHIFLQAGVGAMAGALSAFFAGYWEKKPKITVVEPHGAACCYLTASASDGQIHKVCGEMDTIMAGLCCGEPCPLGWEMLRRYAEHFVSVPDFTAANGMRILGNPIGGDMRIISGESGAATVGFVAELMRNGRLAELRREIGLNENSRVLCISTEGDTDRENYRKIVWEGRFPGVEDTAVPDAD